MRAFFSDGPHTLREDPITGGLNAAIAQWLTESGRARASYFARQGTAIDRHGEVLIAEHDGRIWVGGRTSIVVSGAVNLPGNGNQAVGACEWREQGASDE